MRKTERTFTPAEMRMAAWAIVIASLVTGLVLFMGQNWMQPSLGRYGSDGYTASATPGIQDARPIAG